MSVTTIGILVIVGLIYGVANASPPQKIVGGSPAVSGEFPYQVSLKYSGHHLCGGAIISEQHILTAAHCVAKFNPKLFRVQTGGIPLNGGVLHNVKKIVRHPLYNPANVGSPNDIAIITLKDKIKFNKKQDKIDLPTEAPSSGMTAIATGWGYVSSTSRIAAPELMKVELKTLSNTQCQRYYGPRVNIHRNQFCTLVGRGLGTCRGDSGGPLASSDGKLIGVVSWGIPCAVGLPDVFTSVFHQLSWINQVMKSD